MAANLEHAALTSTSDIADGNTTFHFAPHTTPVAISTGNAAPLTVSSATSTPILNSSNGVAPPSTHADRKTLNRDHEKKEQTPNDSETLKKKYALHLAFKPKFEVLQDELLMTLYAIENFSSLEYPPATQKDTLDNLAKLRTLLQSIVCLKLTEYDLFHKIEDNALSLQNINKVLLETITAIRTDKTILRKMHLELFNVLKEHSERFDNLSGIFYWTNPFIETILHTLSFFKYNSHLIRLKGTPEKESNQRILDEATTMQDFIIMIITCLKRVSNWAKIQYLHKPSNTINQENMAGFKYLSDGRAYTIEQENIVIIRYTHEHYRTIGQGNIGCILYLKHILSSSSTIQKDSLDALAMQVLGDKTIYKSFTDYLSTNKYPNPDEIDLFSEYSADLSCLRGLKAPLTNGQRVDELPPLDIDKARNIWESAQRILAPHQRTSQRFAYWNHLPTFRAVMDAYLMDAVVQTYTSLDPDIQTKYLPYTSVLRTGIFVLGTCLGHVYLNQLTNQRRNCLSSTLSTLGHLWSAFRFGALNILYFMDALYSLHDPIIDEEGNREDISFQDWLDKICIPAAALAGCTILWTLMPKQSLEWLFPRNAYSNTNISRAIIESIGVLFSGAGVLQLFLSLFDIQKRYYQHQKEVYFIPEAIGILLTLVAMIYQNIAPDFKERTLFAMYAMLTGTLLAAQLKTLVKNPPHINSELTGLQAALNAMPFVEIAVLAPTCIVSPLLLHFCSNTKSFFMDMGSRYVRAEDNTPQFVKRDTLPKDLSERSAIFIDTDQRSAQLSQRMQQFSITSGEPDRTFLMESLLAPAIPLNATGAPIMHSYSNLSTRKQTCSERAYGILYQGLTAIRKRVIG